MGNNATAGAESRLVLSGEITLQSAEAIHSQLLEMAGQPTVEIDCGEATDIDLGLIQLILAARASARNSGRTVTLAAPATGALRETLLRGGFISSDADQPTQDQAFWLQAAGIS